MSRNVPHFAVLYYLTLLWPVLRHCLLFPTVGRVLDPSIVGDTERTRFCLKTDRRTNGQMDGQDETSIPHLQLRLSGGYNKYWFKQHPISASVIAPIMIHWTDICTRNILEFIWWISVSISNNFRIPLVSEIMIKPLDWNILYEHSVLHVLQYNSQQYHAEKDIGMLMCQQISFETKSLLGVRIKSLFKNIWPLRPGGTHNITKSSWNQNKACS